jgi:hypothetical protein
MGEKSAIVVPSSCSHARAGVSGRAAGAVVFVFFINKTSFFSAF